MRRRRWPDDPANRGRPHVRIARHRSSDLRAGRADRRIGDRGRVKGLADASSQIVHRGHVATVDARFGEPGHEPAHDRGVANRSSGRAANVRRNELQPGDRLVRQSHGDRATSLLNVDRRVRRVLAHGAAVRDAARISGAARRGPGSRCPRRASLRWVSERTSSRETRDSASALTRTAMIRPRERYPPVSLRTRAQNRSRNWIWAGVSKRDVRLGRRVPAETSVSGGMPFRRADVALSVGSAVMTM